MSFSTLEPIVTSSINFSNYYINAETCGLVIGSFIGTIGAWFLWIGLCCTLEVGIFKFFEKYYEKK